MTDIVERLRISITKGHEPTDEDAIEAANEIERLRSRERNNIADWYALRTCESEIKRLREDNKLLRTAIERLQSTFWVNRKPS